MSNIDDPNVDDVIVVGAGVAGLTAALFASRLGLQTRVLCPEGPGGALLSIEMIEDLPGFLDPVAGFEFCPMLQEQAQNAGAVFDMATLTGLGGDARSGWRLQTDAGELATRTVILATGSVPRALGIPGEAHFVGRGVSHCASCDGPLYVGKDVIVIGDSDAAFVEALTLHRCGARTTIVHAGANPEAMATYRRRVEDSTIVVHPRTTALEVLGDSVVTGLRVDDDGSNATLPASGVFVYIGRDPTTAVLADLVELDGDGHIVTDVAMRTRSAGLFAAGDVRAGVPRRFAVTAAGDGATAAVSAATFLGVADAAEMIVNEAAIGGR